MAFFNRFFHVTRVPIVYPLSPPPKYESKLKIHDPFITTYFLQLIVRIWPFHFSFLPNVFNFRRFLPPKSFTTSPPNRTSYVQFSPYFFSSKTCLSLHLRLAPTPPTPFSWVLSWTPSPPHDVPFYAPITVLPCAILSSSPFIRDSPSTNFADSPHCFSFLVILCLPRLLSILSLLSHFFCRCLSSIFALCPSR